MNFMFFYKLALPVFSPVSLVFLILIACFYLYRKEKWLKVYLGICLSILWIFGNGWFSHWLAQSLERQNLPHAPVPNADAIMLLGGGILPREYPRDTIEFGDSGDRLFYASYLFKQGKAPFIVCTGGVVPGNPRPTTHADDMGSLLEMLGIPGESILLETKSTNTRENASYSLALLQERQVKKILLVTSAMHMPRSLGVFRKIYKDIDIIPAPTDFRETEHPKPPFLMECRKVIPTADNISLFSEVLHEYIGIVYYKCRGWM